MQVHIQKWKIEDAKKLQNLCDQADRRYLSDRLPHPYTLQNGSITPCNRKKHKKASFDRLSSITI